MKTRLTVLALLLAVLLTSCAPPESVQHLEQGKKLAAQSQFDQALAEYDQAIEHDAKLAEAYLRRGIAHYQISDYEAAITENTAALLRVHPSNYKISGFTAEVPLAQLVPLARARGLVVIDDVGAGPLVDFSRFGFEKEPTLPESVAAGADIITSSADKLIGGSQGGIILGRAPLIQAIRKNPLARIVRPGKLALAALEATLTLFLDESVALREVPTLRMLRRDGARVLDDAQGHQQQTLLPVGLGLIELDPETQARRVRPSGELYAEICKENGLSSEMVAKYCPEAMQKIFPD